MEPTEEEKKEYPADAGSVWLVRVIVVLFIAALVLSGLIVKAVFFTKKVPRTAVERDLMKYQAAVKKNPSDWQSRISLGLTYYTMEDYESAIRDLKLAIKLKPRASNGHYYIALAYLGKKDTEKAVKELESAIELDTQHDLARYQLANIYMKQNKYEQAITQLKKCLEINPVDANYHYSLGLAYEKTNHKSLAKKEFQEALKYVPDFEEAKEALRRLSS